MDFFHVSIIGLWKTHVGEIVEKLVSEENFLKVYNSTKICGMKLKSLSNFQYFNGDDFLMLVMSLPILLKHSKKISDEEYDLIVDHCELIRLCSEESFEIEFVDKLLNLLFPLR